MFRAVARIEILLEDFDKQATEKDRSYWAIRRFIIGIAANAPYCAYGLKPEPLAENSDRKRANQFVSDLQQAFQDHKWALNIAAVAALNVKALAVHSNPFDYYAWKALILVRLFDAIDEGEELFAISNKQIASFARKISGDLAPV